MKVSGACTLLALFWCALLGCGGMTERNAEPSGFGGSSGVSASSSEGGAPAVSTGSAGGGGPLCRDATGRREPCLEGEYCDYFADTCHAREGRGRCTPVPEGCADVYEPICGCDGTVYGNACEAARRGADAAPAETCPAPEGWFGCGSNFCPAGAYCQRVISDILDEPPMDTCVPLPAACAETPSCDCLASEPCGERCAASASGFELTCGGGIR